jgi:hypothetical protein
MSQRSVAFIATSSAAGKDLMRAAQVLAERTGYSFSGYPAPAQVVAARVMAQADVAILDATVEPGGGSAYRSFTAQPFAYNHVLVVSRTPLPLNFHGRRTRAPERLHAFSNQALLDWLEGQLSELAAQPRRTGFQRTLIGASVDIFRPSYAAQADPDKRGSGHHAFVSYRREALKQARDLAAGLRAGRFAQSGGPADVTFLEPGVIAFDDEILTAQLRWHLTSLLSERIGECGSLWICDSPNYLGSWWTRTELVLHRYFSYRDSEHRRRLYRYRPRHGRVDETPDIVPAISHEQKRHIDRMISNTGSTMPADTVAKSREIGQLPGFRKFSFWTDPVFSEDFARVPLLDTGLADPAPASLSAALVQSTIDLDDERLVPVPGHVLEAIENGGSAVCNGFRLYRDQQQGARYLWYPVRRGKPTAPSGSLDDTLQALPILRAQPAGT